MEVHSKSPWLLLLAAIGVFGPTALVPVCAAAHSSAERPVVAEEKKEAAAETPEDGSELAARLAECLDDGEFKSRLLLSLVEHHLRRGQAATAIAIAENIPGYRRGIALARSATAEARLGRAAEAIALLEKAQASGHYPHAWQLESILAEVGVAWMALDRPKQAAEIRGRLTDEAALIRLASGSALEQARRGQPFESTAFHFAPATSKPAPERLEAARALLSICELRMAGAEADVESPAADVPALLEKTEEILQGSRSSAGEDYLDLGLLWRRLGKTEKSAEVLGKALRQLPPGVEMQGWREGYLGRMVAVYREGGDEAGVELLLARARQGVAPLHRFHRPPALCQIAEAEWQAGQPEKASATWQEAAEVALQNPNPDSQFLGGAQVAMSLARAGAPFPPGLKERLARLASKQAQTAGSPEP